MLNAVESMDEMEEIRQKYESGRFDHIRRDLEHFLTAHRAEILKLKSDTSLRPREGEVTGELAVKLYILKHRTINPQADIQEEIEEIQKEKWIRGVQTGRSPDADEVMKDWARQYSKGWREHRIRSIIYCFEREKERYLGLLGPLEGPAS